ncbi:MAG: DegT/DnrJ/EryC1/StrS family aminotransferase, partial [Actinomycetota bacterium]|nr:DegT/DnrJ/EryC1/StrS family aminotransferase [Actinomycetota bacterium]
MTHGPLCERFEHEFATTVTAEHAISV